ncbi:hypothetical protein RhiirA4_549502 [Rhizophagus irregularis]|uniref:Uncharacterized protein n=1 Tax=Rhizophagus irregularis TaxID=588596 RepID=A0A2I1HDS9_9GLOM|nr:hypothetical protein RhiirA4_549502 [Rhizophagus irregularis]
MGNVDEQNDYERETMQQRSNISINDEVQNNPNFHSEEKDKTPDDNGKIVYYALNNLDYYLWHNIRAKMILEGKSIFEWGCYYWEKCTYAWVGVCSSENLIVKLLQELNLLDGY